MRSFALAIGLVLCVALATTSVSTGADPEHGSISGTLKDPKSVKSVVAVNRTTKKRFPGKVDQDGGRFTINGLPLKATYDCIIDFEKGRLEGINLKVPRSDYVEEQPLSKEDIETIRGKVRRMNKFEDIVEIKTIQGNIQHAAILISKLRTKPFFGSKPGEVIWRAELWHFERPEETWLKVQDELFIVLYRERINESVYAKKSLTFDPVLGGITLNAKQPSLDLKAVKPPLAKPGIHLREKKKQNDS